jgi:hypothetical protein
VDRSERRQPDQQQDGYEAEYATTAESRAGHEPA